MTYEEYLELPDSGAIVEWAKGEVLFHMPPTLYHQNITLFLSLLLDSYVKLLQLGAVVVAPFEVRLAPDGPSREPDVSFISTAQLGQLTQQRFDGAPDLIIEVVSPSSLTLDRVAKFREYEQAGVREYWIIDPRPHQQQADFYTLDPDGRFVPAPVDESGTYTASVLPGFRLRVAWLWETPLPNHQRALAEIMAQSPALSAELRAVYADLLRLLSD
jgi:Uma2 family endonuclease